MKERIDHTNYEAWLLDRLEGRLSPEQERELEGFLAANPELVPDEGPLPELDGSFNITPIPFKDELKKELPPKGVVAPWDLEDHLVARLEGDLSREQLLALEKFLYEHPEHAEDSRLYSFTRFQRSAIHFPAKAGLQRELPPQGAITRYDLEDHLIARLEGDLSAGQEKDLERYLNENADARELLTQLARARIEAHPVHFPHKAGLRKGGRVIAIGFRQDLVRLAAAASVALLLGVAVWSILKHADGEDLLASTQVSVPVEDVGSIKEVDVTTAPEARSEDKNTAPETTVEPLVAEVHTTAPKQDRMHAPVREEARPSVEDAVPTYADHRPVQLPPVEIDRQPMAVVEESAPFTMVEEEAPALAEVIEEQPQVTANVGHMVANALRDKVLPNNKTNTGALDADDAVAVVDRGLKAVAGERAGLEVERHEGKVSRFDLRIGRGFAITASTGR